ncbi:MAG: phosphate butyryltransferase [Candidatus Marinimicrobia bacterium]|nr:phosphate butyryltransferase [Candidatus Neomarinimicrobiota bacterium]MBL7023091.1 phosphate butyryltransferase [Candidatus Neomarinimicrobiota bacterium]MBL7109111.1 phosphate butyryltransferase [Candidatus Neomarinimicrobiota bacterium]
MIRSFEELYQHISLIEPISIGVVNPKQDYIFSALKEAEKLGWITPPVIFEDDNDIQAANLAVQAISEKKVQLLMKGDVDTATILKAVLNPEFGIRTNRRLSHIAVVKPTSYDRLMLMTDGGVNPILTPQILDSVIQNAVDLANILGITHPHIAILSLIEKVNPKIPETIIADETVKRYKNDKSITIEGPVALDVAISQKAAERKGIHSKIAGKTDIFIGPNITTTNFVVKSLMGLGEVQGGGIILGAKSPVILLSRSDTMEARLNSIALGICANVG